MAVTFKQAQPRACMHHDCCLQMPKEEFRNSFDLECNNPDQLLLPPLHACLTCEAPPVTYTAALVALP
jgi:hypothetical protein